MSDIVKARLKKEADRLSGKYGSKTGALGSAKFKLNVVPTGILALDYALGTGGWPLGHPVEIYGAPDIGKSSVLGLSALRNAQKMNMTTGIIAVEPGFDEEWAQKNGVDPDMLIIARPDDGEVAFSILYDWIAGDIVDFVVFDSIGAILRASESGEGGKPNQGGASSLITWGVKNVLQPCWKNNKGLLFLNQQREVMRSQIPGQYESPGGQALKHAADIRIHLRAGKDQYKTKDPNPDPDAKDNLITVGRSLVAQIKRNKLAEGSGKKAVFDYYQMDTEDQVVGIDVGQDVVNTALRTGVVKKAGAWFYHESFPGGKFNGRAAVEDFILTDEARIERIRNEVLQVMFEKVTPVVQEAVGE